MFLYKLVDSVKIKKINVHNKGNHFRDFTYIDDVIDQILKIINQPSTNNIPYQIFNIGSSRPIHLLKFIKIIEKYLGKKAN